MTDNPEQNLQSKEQTAETPKQGAEKQNQTPKSKGPEEPNRDSSKEDFFKNLRDKGIADNINELFQGLGAANFFIDARSGGAYFAEQVDIAGDVVGVNQTKWSTDSSRRSFEKYVAGQISPKLIEKISSVYVQTDSYVQAKRILMEKQILILWGDAKVGKEATAIHLLLSVLQGENILVIDPSEKDFSSFQSEAKNAYLAPASSGKLSNYLLNSLSQQFIKQNSYLVITIDSHVRLSQDHLGEYIVKWKNLPTTETLLKKHLAWYLKDQTILDSCYTFTQKDSVRELLNYQRLPHEIDNLAKHIANGIRNGDEIEQVLASFDVRRVKEQVESWFEEHQDLSQRVFMIALAVLNGGKYQAVLQASQDLESAMKPPSEKEKEMGKEKERETDSEPLFHKTRSQRVKEVKAKLIQGFEDTEFGSSPVERIELDNHQFRSAILSYVWHEYDRLREPLLKWLYELGLNLDFDGQRRAAETVGELSKYSFSFVCEKVLLPWGECKQQYVKALVAQALIIPVYEGDLAPQVLMLLDYWRTVDNRDLCWTATFAYWAYGLRFPETTLRKLLMIATSEEKCSAKEQVDRELFFSTAALAVACLFRAGQYFDVLKALLVWTQEIKAKGGLTNSQDGDIGSNLAFTTELLIAENKDTTKDTERQKIARLFGLYIFVLFIFKTKAPAESNQKNLAILLWLAWEENTRSEKANGVEELRRYEDIIVCLLQRALNEKLFREQVFKEIHNWLELVEKDHHLFPTVGLIIFKLTARGSERERNRIVKKLEKWEILEQSKAAKKILSKIKKHLNL